LRVKGYQAAVLGHLIYTYPFFIHAVLHAAIPAIVLIYAHLAGGFTAAYRAVQTIASYKIS
jgi:hypothetical protein